MVWCIQTGNYLEFSKESVCAFFTRNSIPISAHTIVKVHLKESAYSSEETLHLNSQLEPSPHKTHIYILTKPEHTFSIDLNSYARDTLRTQQNKITLYTPSNLPVLSVISTLKKYFPSFHFFHYFSLYYRIKTPHGRSLKQAKPNETVCTMPSVLYLQPVNPFELARMQSPSFTGEFYQLKTLNSSTVFSKKYTVSIYGHFLFAVKKGSSSPLGQSLEVTADLIAYKQTVGNRSLAVIEQGGTRWSLYSRNSEAVESLLYYIEQTPKYQPREIGAETAKSWERKCHNVQNIISHNISSSSLPRAAVLFPQDVPMVREELNEIKSPGFLIRKLEAHIQRSIWDNVNIEFIVYLLHLQGFSLTAEIHQEIRDFSAHRKRILSKLKEMENAL
ncbi:hypothetical protein NEMIN01_0232 [Nematocida minor]|uniref:uncharacterized protein n=1 Tax=Nematocida minor TaxID=1912983 RepID=UPI00221E68B9|nr:uncharacterized protein NEMIN01_0232 [Nematocida minor]KAI5188968.1 hypothetical protein NEMIN01_0232 [Nematocida minor]